jgi:hypothetical protein
MKSAYVEPESGRVYAPTDWWNTMHMSTQLSRVLSSISTSCKNFSATLFRASDGHSLNQSMVQQLGPSK